MYVLGITTWNSVWLWVFLVVVWFVFVVFFVVGFVLLLLEEPSCRKLHGKVVCHIAPPRSMLETWFCTTRPIYCVPSCLSAFADPSLHFCLGPKGLRNVLFCLMLVLFTLIWQVVTWFRIACATENLFLTMMYFPCSFKFYWPLEVTQQWLKS